MKNIFWFLIICSVVLWTGCTGSDNDGDNVPPVNNTTPVMSYSIITSLPHDTSYFTEGLEFYNNTLLESTGNYGHSKLVQKDSSGKIIRELNLDPKYFGEGITVLHDTLYQLTYKEGIVHVYSVKDFKKTGELPFVGEGWGLTNDGHQIIASNGSNNLYFYEPGTFKLLKTLAVTENDAPAVNINELEYVNGYVYANQWQYNYILKIDLKSGKVVAKIDMTNLVNQIKATDPHADVLNGIALNRATNKMYVTGKYWPRLFEVGFDR